MIAGWLANRARGSPAAVAVECGGQRLTYAELWRRAQAVAGRLTACGLAPGDRVATVTENDAGQVALLFGCALARLALVPLNWRLTPAELAAQLGVVSPALVASPAAHADRAAEALRTATLTLASLSSPSLMPLDELTGPGPPPGSGRTTTQPGAVQHRATGDDPLLIVFTSGSTGRPKGAVLTQANCLWTNLSLDSAVPAGAGDVVLQVLPQHHVAGWNVQPLLGWWKGATVLLEPSFDPRRALGLIEARRVTTMMGVPATYLMLAEAPGFGAADLSSLRRVVVGGAAMPPDLLALWRERGVAVAQGYGLTEAAPNVLCLPPGQAAAHPGSVGRPYRFVDVELHDPGTGQRIDGAGTGELWVSGPNVFAGYFGDQAATAEAVTVDAATAEAVTGGAATRKAVTGAGQVTGRWLRTGDLAERDRDGYYRVCGRRKDLYISGGENVYPAEVEAVLREHPAVADAAVVGTPDRRWGETGVAFVEFRAGRSASAAELTGHCRQRLAGFKIPRQVVPVTALPRLGTGKPDKRALARMVPEMAQ